MVLKVFDVDQGSCNFVKTGTGKTELVDFGGKLNWSPVDHVYANYIDYSQGLDRLVLTHHHGDHLQDWASFKARRPGLVLRRKLTGDYLTACRRSNSAGRQELADQFAAVFDSWDATPSDWTISDEAWGVDIRSWYLTVEQATYVSSTDNSLVNNCSYVRLYDHAGTKILMCGDMEKEGMSALLDNSPGFRSAVRGVNVLIAPHHGHRTGFSTELFEAMGKVNVVIASMMSGDVYVDTRYSDSQYVQGIPFDDGTMKRLLTTRSHGAITVDSRGAGSLHVTIGQR